METSRDVQRLGPQLYNGIAKQSTAFKLLAGMGWKEGDGLGASKQGIKEHIKVKKKFNTSGMGSDEQGAQLRDWTAGMFTYDKLLSGLKEVSAAPNHPQSTDSSSEDIDGEDAAADRKQSNSKSTTSSREGDAASPIAASGRKGKKPGKQQKLKNKGKEARKKAAAAAAASSGLSSDSSLSDDSDAAAPAQITTGRSSARGTHLGRYQKRERAKMVGAYSANDLAAILGAMPGAAPAATNGGGAALYGVSAGRPGSPSSSDDEEAAGNKEDGSSSSSSEDESKQQQQQQQQQQQKKKKRIGQQSKGTENSPLPSLVSSGSRGKDAALCKPDKPAPWWFGLFVRAGRMGSKKTSRQAEAAAGDKNESNRIRINGFREEDQENLALQAKQHATQNKQGLGRSEVPKMAAGARWCGSKTKLGSDDEEEGGEGDEGGSVTSGDYDDEESLPNKLVILTSKVEQEQGLAYPKGCEPATGKEVSSTAVFGHHETAAIQGAEEEPKAKQRRDKKGKEGKRSRKSKPKVAGAAEEETFSFLKEETQPSTVGKKKSKDRGHEVKTVRQGTEEKKGKKKKKKNNLGVEAQEQVEAEGAVEAAKKKEKKRKAEETGDEMDGPGGSHQPKAAKAGGAKKKGSKRLKKDAFGVQQ